MLRSGLLALLVTRSYEQRASLRTERSDARGGWRPSRRREEKPSEGEVVAVGPGSVKDKRESRRSKEQRKMNTKCHDEQNRKKKELRTERRKVKVENPSRFLPLDAETAACSEKMLKVLNVPQCLRNRWAAGHRGANSRLDSGSQLSLHFYLIEEKEVQTIRGWNEDSSWQVWCGRGAVLRDGRSKLGNKQIIEHKPRTRKEAHDFVPFHSTSTARSLTTTRTMFLPRASAWGMSLDGMKMNELRNSWMS